MPLDILISKYETGSFHRVQSPWVFVQLFSSELFLFMGCCVWGACRFPWPQTLSAPQILSGFREFSPPHLCHPLRFKPRLPSSSLVDRPSLSPWWAPFLKPKHFSFWERCRRQCLPLSWVPSFQRERQLTVSVVERLGGSGEYVGWG